MTLCPVGSLHGILNKGLCLLVLNLNIVENGIFWSLKIAIYISSIRPLVPLSSFVFL